MGWDVSSVFLKSVLLVVPPKPVLAEIYCDTLSHSADAKLRSRARTAISSSSR